MSILAAGWMYNRFRRLLFGEGMLGRFHEGPVDLLMRHGELQAIFAGEPIYETMNNAVYPPASYFMLWPLLGWVDAWGARWVWAVTLVFMLIWLCYLTMRESGERVPIRRLSLFLLPLISFPLGLTIRIGQTGVHLLPLLITSVLLLKRYNYRWIDVLAALLFTIALIKPTVAAPFFWLILFVPGRIFPGLIVLACYTTATLAMASFQQADTFTLMMQWVEKGAAGAAYGAKIVGTFNTQTWLHALDVKHFSLELSLVLLGLFGLLVFYFRDQEVWLLLGITALVSRFWIYHSAYDDLLVLLPMITLYRLIQQEDTSVYQRVLAGTLFVTGVFTTLTPLGSWRLPQLWISIYQIFQAITWMTMLVYLVYIVWQRKQQHRGASSIAERIPDVFY